MGQQTMLEAGSTLRRMITVVALATLMTLIMAASAMPAMAKVVKNSDGRPSETGDTTGANGGGIVVGHGAGESCVIHDGSKFSGHCT